ncbi:hypothetical protein M9458_023754, partial [Cirrhinus mrigala]
PVLRTLRSSLQPCTIVSWGYGASAGRSLTDSQPSASATTTNPARPPQCLRLLQ